MDACRYNLSGLNASAEKSKTGTKTEHTKKGREKTYHIVCADGARLRWPEAVDLVVLDPPRAGAKSVLGAILKAQPKEIIYVSCNPATLSRDIKRLISQGPYEINYAAGFDMFPQTSHIEAVVRLVMKTELSYEGDERVQTPPNPSP